MRLHELYTKTAARNEPSSINNVLHHSISLDSHSTAQFQHLLHHERKEQTLTLNMQCTLFLPFIIVLAAFEAVASQNISIAKSGCMDRCGNVSIPFPFGTDARCYHNQSFWVTCNKSSDGSTSLFWPESSNIEILSISLSGQIRVLPFIAYECPSISSRASIIQLPENFTFNSTANKFVVVGHGTDGYLSGVRNNLNYLTGCRTKHTMDQDLEKGSCRASGCCQTFIPPDAQTANITVKMDHSDMEYNCTYGFLAEGNAFEFSLRNLTYSLDNVTKLPVLVDWAVGYENCKDTKNSLCISENSTCYEPDTGGGYRCRCDDGYDGNPYLIYGCLDINECNLEPKKCHHHCKNTVGGYECRCRRGYHGDGRVDGSGCSRDELLIVKIVTGIFSGIILLLLTVWLASFQLNRRKLTRMMKKHFIDNGGMRLQQELAKMNDPAPGFAERRLSAGTFKIFKQSEMEEATDRFSSIKLRGKGGFGRVYKGKLWDGREVAIKEPIRIDTHQIDNFITEVIVLSQINHKNVVKLLGCCLERETPLLVYEFISNGDLSSYLDDPIKAPQLDWRKRLNIAIETAGALSYLHFDTTTRIIHRDIKSDNILLDQNFTAKVSDFGASRLVPLDQTLSATHLIGTRGYLDPEFDKTGKLTTESDVYSFGAVLLELLTEKRPMNFVGIFRKSMQQESQRESLLFELVVDHIVSEDNKDQITKVAELALRCLSLEGKDRPSMKEVESELKKLV